MIVCLLNGNVYAFFERSLYFRDGDVLLFVLLVYVGTSIPLKMS